MALSLLLLPPSFFFIISKSLCKNLCDKDLSTVMHLSQMRRNIPCHLTDVSCGNPCGKTLPCGMHKCKRTCHKDNCLSNTLEGCQQPCTLQRKFCGHECGNPCHVDQPCPDTPCKTTIIVKCKCGRRSEKMLCLACGSGAMHQTFQK